MLPNLVIIGAAKCGTTSLHYYLNLHPQIFMSEMKELNFFAHEGHWKLGVKWYELQFPANMKRNIKIYGEATPKYTHYPNIKDAAEKMF